ncbi:MULTISPECIES: peptide deformylase [unclassified Enterococcus]|uniref:peptide deformylase n=1 Tax=unclassified Enterococcus TaxID=2608891 RepID=UPI001553F9C2|nr:MULTISPECIES: peptide deformylase [unclassified Enterococcus]MBS7576857.1 peptide deformylase [Enterococcus sp. MMGLQ5-2]MBS7584264.1 peptide deformylase [Enterococcus sp. MMGLQ5-1]NPD12120.1 peptide deformylase [Enterococcus sp. MMGLQ5-1]NPD36692.1 peptide deformylase [Enterococcus sp. MMGLQ5-2]
MIREIVVLPDEGLRQQTEQINEITSETLDLLDDLYDTMISGDGVGIAAPQIGESVKIAMVQLDDGELLELINPKIILATGSDIFVEGCLSIPNMYGTVRRNTKIVVNYLDRDGEQCQIIAEAYLARVIQHEIDHLNGILFIDKMIEEIPENELEAYYEKHDNS